MPYDAFLEVAKALSNMLGTRHAWVKYVGPLRDHQYKRTRINRYFPDMTKFNELDYN